jgi:ribosomal protein S18 acetylase RimI-like enzyme
MGNDAVQVRNTEPSDYAAIADLCRRVYPETTPWTAEQLGSHYRLFPEGQFVALLDGRVVGMCASLVVHWDDYSTLDDWERFTNDGMFTNHDPQHGHTLYAAEAIVDPTIQHHGIGGALYSSRFQMVERLRLRRIRGGGRLRGYHRYAPTMDAAKYVEEIVHGRLSDDTLSFQLHENFHVLAVVPHYLHDDPESLGWAAVIEWLNPLQLRPEHVQDRPTTHLHPLVAAAQRKGETPAAAQQPARR